MDPAHLQQVRHWATEGGEGLTPEARAAAATALAAAENGVSAEDRSAALKWARTAARRGATAAERSAARSIVALLEDRPEPRAQERPIEQAEASTSHEEEQPVVPKERKEARPRRSRVSAATIRQRRIVALAVVGAIALLVASVAGARSVFAPSLKATGPAGGAHLDAARLAKLEFSVTGASNVRWTLDGSDVSARAARKGSTQTLRPGAASGGGASSGGQDGAAASSARRRRVAGASPSTRPRRRSSSIVPPPPSRAGRSFSREGSSPGRAY